MPDEEPKVVMVLTSDVCTQAELLEIAERFQFMLWQAVDGIAGEDSVKLTLEV